MTAADVALINRWPTSEFNDFGAVPADWMLNTAIGRAVVIRNQDDAIIGRVSWHRVHYGPNPESAAWNVGIELLAEARGQGCGSEAQRLLAQHLFATTPLNRVEAVTDVGNAAELRALAAAGFRREGVLRGAQFRASQWRDVVICAVLRGEV